jgi:hypothetical protein
MVEIESKTIADDEIIKKLELTDLNNLTPIEALNLLISLKDKIK